MFQLFSEFEESNSTGNNIPLAESATTGFTAGQLESLRILSRVLSSFSILGAFSVILLFFLLKSIRSFALELVVWLCLSDIFFNMTVYFPVYDTDNQVAWESGALSTSCKMQAIVNILFDLSTLIWTTIIGYTAYISLTSQEYLDQNQGRFRIYFIFIAFLPPTILALIVMFSKGYGPSGVFCWIASQTPTVWINLLILTYYSSTWLIIGFNCFCVCKLIVLLKKELQGENEIIEKYTDKLKWYPIIQIISYLPCTCNRVYELIFNDSVFPIVITQVIFDSLTGLAFAIVYGFNREVRSAAWQVIQTIVCCKKWKRGSTISSTSTDSAAHDNTQQGTTTIQEDFDIKNFSIPATFTGSLFKK